MASVLLIQTQAANANDLSYLPPLGNTDSVDRALSREVGDDFVFSAETAVQLPTTRLSQAIETKQSLNPD